MALDLQKYKAKKVRTLTADLGDGDTVDFSYDSSKYTQDFVKELKKIAGTAEGDEDIVVSLDVANFAIRNLVTDIDALDGGKKIQLTEASISALPLEFTGPIVAKIFEDQNPGND